MSTSFNYGRYSHAIVCRVPDSFKRALGANDSVDVEEARREHEEYCRVLRSLGLDVIELPADENFPDCPYVEDTAVIVNGVALICKPGHPSRAREVDTIRAIIKKELKLPIIEMADPRATLDGGDVLFTGREFFVGLSQRTNEAGARAVAAAFPEFPVTPIKIPNKLLHLKGCMSMAGVDILAVSSSPEAQEILKRMEREANHRYNTITIPDNSASNVLFVNGTLVHRSEFPQVTAIFEDKIDYARVAIKMWELSKPNANLSCLSIFIKKPRQVHTIV